MLFWDSVVVGELHRVKLKTRLKFPLLTFHSDHHSHVETPLLGIFLRVGGNYPFIVNTCGQNNVLRVRTPCSFCIEGKIQFDVAARENKKNSWKFFSHQLTNETILFFYYCLHIFSFFAQNFPLFLNGLFNALYFLFKKDSFHWRKKIQKTFLTDDHYYWWRVHYYYYAFI